MNKILTTLLSVATIANAGVLLDALKQEPKIKVTETEDFSIKAVTPQAKKFIEEYVEPKAVEVYVPPVVPVMPVLILSEPESTPWTDNLYAQIGVGMTGTEQKLRYYDQCKDRSFCYKKTSNDTAYLARVGYDWSENFATYIEYDKVFGSMKTTRIKHDVLMVGAKYTYSKMNLFMNVGKSRSEVDIADASERVFAFKTGFGYDIATWLGVEASYMGLGSIEMPATKLNANILGVYATIKLGGV